MFGKVKKFVDKSFGRKVPHFERTVYWIKKLKAGASEALLISGYAHDIERAFQKNPLKKLKEGGFISKKFLDSHQKRSAKIMMDFLKKEGAEKDAVKKVGQLISCHEYGGDDEQNVLKDADSISFFECNVESIIEKFAREVGKDKVKEKFDWMYKRITSKKAKQIAKPMYRQAIKLLYLLTSALAACNAYG